MILSISFDVTHYAHRTVMPNLRWQTAHRMLYATTIPLRRKNRMKA